MSTYIAEAACVDPRAEIAEDVEIGPYCVIGPDVRIGRGTRLVSHVTVLGHVTIGEFNQLSPFCVIGGEPQDLSYRGAPTRVEIGDYNVIRESVTVNRATEKEDGVTRVGNYNYLMACTHLAHDVKMGDHVVMANGTIIGGHTHIESHASLSGNVAVHHFATIGRYSFVGGASRIYHDVPPYMLVDGNPSRVRCINQVGLKRNRFAPEEIASLSEAHRLLYRAKMGLQHAREILTSNAGGQLTQPVEILLKFIEAQHAGKHGRGRERWRTQ